MKLLVFSECWWQFLLLALGAYLFGNINFAIMISRLKKKDIRGQGSGNPGTLNMSRTFGAKIGLLTLALDIMKGAIPTLAAYFIYKNYVFAGSNFVVSDLMKAVCGACVILGHVFPVFFKFHGGKGVASTIGVYMVSTPWVSLILILAAVTFVYFTELGSVGSFIAITPPAILYAVNLIVSYGTYNAPLVALIIAYACVALSMVLVYGAHHQNLYRLFHGQEHPTSIKAMLKRKPKQENEQQ